MSFVISIVFQHVFESKNRFSLPRFLFWWRQMRGIPFHFKQKAKEKTEIARNLERIKEMASEQKPHLSAITSHTTVSEEYILVLRCQSLFILTHIHMLAHAVSSIYLSLVLCTIFSSSFEFISQLHLCLTDSFVDSRVSEPFGMRCWFWCSCRRRRCCFCWILLWPIIHSLASFHQIQLCMKHISTFE